MSKKFGRSRQFRNWPLGIIIIFLPWLLVFLIRELGPITYSPLSGEFLWFLLASLATSFLMYSLAYFPIGSQEYGRTLVGAANDDHGISKRFFRLLYTCTALFAVLAFYDYLLVKGASLSEIVATRELEHVTGPRNSLIGACVALLSGAPPLLMALLLTRHDAFGHKRMYLYATIFFGFAAMFLSGGRNPFFIGLLFVLGFYWFFSPKQRLIFKTWKVWIVALAIILGVAYSMYMFIERSIYVGVVLDSMIDTLSINYGLSIYPFMPESELLTALYTIMVFLIFYATHALNYISDYFAESYSPMLNGAYTVPQLARLLDLMTGADSFNQSRTSLLVDGAYLTSPGSFYLDFGFLGAVVLSGFLSFVFGRYIARLASLTLLRKMILIYLIIMFIFSPIYCVFGMSNGFSIIFLFVILLLNSFRGGRRTRSISPLTVSVQQKPLIPK